MMDFEEFKQLRVSENESWGYFVYADVLKQEFERYKAFPELYLPPSEPTTEMVIEDTANLSTSIDPPILTVAFFILAGLALIGGGLLGKLFWPGESRLGYEWKPAAYTLSIVWIIAGILEACLFSAIGSALHYLKIISENTAKT